VEMNGNRNGCEPKGLDRYDLVMAVDGKWKNGKCRARPKRASVGKTKADADGADLTSDGLWFTVCGLRFTVCGAGRICAWALADSRVGETEAGTTRHSVGEAAGPRAMHTTLDTIVIPI
jgi:hypothetical protein